MHLFKSKSVCVCVCFFKPSFPVLFLSTNCRTRMIIFERPTLLFIEVLLKIVLVVKSKEKAVFAGKKHWTAVGNFHK